jgi:hypothetical protein
MLHPLRLLAAIVPILLLGCDSNPEAPRVPPIPPQPTPTPEAKPSPGTRPKGASPRARGVQVPE